MTLNSDFHQAPAFGGDERAEAPFQFAPTFIIDFATSSVTVALFVFALCRAPHPTVVGEIAVALGFLIALCYLGKVLIIGFLNRNGGDARDYVISYELVTTGVYAYSRNPTYLLTLVQYVLWSALLIVLQFSTPVNFVLLSLSLLVPIVFFLIMDQVIAREDAALSAKHPEAFAIYASEVGRWFGRKRRRA